VAAPERDVVSSTWGYHPSVADADEIVRATKFVDLLIFGQRVPDVVDVVDEVRQAAPPTQLPVGVYWFSGLERPTVLVVFDGSPAVPGLHENVGEVADGSALDNTLAWIEASWDSARVVPPPAFAVGEQVIVASSGSDGIVKGRRRFVVDRWNYEVFSAGATSRLDENAITARPMADDANGWVRSDPVTPGRFASTLTRAKLRDHFTDTVYSFRATRTIFRPYQFKPVLKLLGTGSMRLLIADEVGLGKTIEAGLVWTELEARRQANRVLVVCPSALLSKWRREMDERFGFELIELDVKGLDDLLGSLETGRVKRRVAYVCSIERMRTWGGLERATELGLTFDLVIVDEAHAFRNSETKSFALGDELQTWAESLVMLSATPINLRTRDLYNLLTLLAPGEFEDEAALALRVEPNQVLNRVSRSLTDETITNADRARWLEDVPASLFGSALSLRPDYALLSDLLAQPQLSPTESVQVRRLCTELNALSAQISRTRKVEVQEDKPLRVPQPVEVTFDPSEASFYAAFFEWCRERAAVAGTPLNFAMQMPLRLAGSCLPEAAQSVLDWSRPAEFDFEFEEDHEARRGKAVPSTAKSAEVPPPSDLVRLARDLKTDTKFRHFTTVVDELAAQGKRALVFTFSKRTLRYLQRRLATSPHRVAVLHGDVPRRDRDKIMADFRAGAYDFLLATKVASEGLDFEFCSAVVNYDLPWNPMEIEQRIGRIDRIGQRENKLAVWNFNTPGTIEETIRERVHERIQVFERTIGELEPILDSRWRQIEKLIFDFTLSEAERDQRIREAVLAVEEQAKSLEDVESAAPNLISADGADIDGLERDLLANGRYIGQPELGHLLADWAETFGGRTSLDGTVLTLRGNAEMADHVQTLVRTGERVSAEVAEYAALLRNEQPILVSLDQEAARTGAVDLITATHVLTRAATQTPGYRQGRFARLALRAADAGVPQGTFLTLLSVVKWNGLRPFNEVWSSTIDLDTLNDAGDTVGAAVMKGLAEGTLAPAQVEPDSDLTTAVEEAIHNLQTRVHARRATLDAENAAFLQARRTSYQEVHDRRVAHLKQTLSTNIDRGNLRVIRANEGKIRKAEQRLHAQLADLDQQSAASLEPEDLAVCVVEVTP
jgi:superfamily II DNA or RNA helicase